MGLSETFLINCSERGTKLCCALPKIPRGIFSYLGHSLCSTMVLTAIYLTHLNKKTALKLQGTTVLYQSPIN